MLLYLLAVAYSLDAQVVRLQLQLTEMAQDTADARQRSEASAADALVRIDQMRMRLWSDCRFSVRDVSASRLRSSWMPPNEFLLSCARLRRVRLRQQRWRCSTLRAVHCCGSCVSITVVLRSLL